MAYVRTFKLDIRDDYYLVIAIVRHVVKICQNQLLVNR